MRSDFPPPSLPNHHFAFGSRNFATVITLAALAILGIACPDSVETPGLEKGRPGGDWLSGVQSAIECEEYHASVSAAGLQAPNRAQNIRTYFKDSGIEVVPRSAEKPAWRWQWQTTAWGREGHIQPIPLHPADPSGCARRVRARGARRVVREPEGRAGAGLHHQRVTGRRGTALYRGSPLR